MTSPVCLQSRAALQINVGGLCHLPVLPAVVVTSEAKVAMILLLGKHADCHVSLLHANAQLDRQAGSDQLNC